MNPGSTSDFATRIPGVISYDDTTFIATFDPVALLDPDTVYTVTVLDNIGRTRLTPLQHIVPKESARILVKLEYENPTGSMKDRMALAMVEAAEADGRLPPGGSVIEYTGGSTGVAVAMRVAERLGPDHAVVEEITISNILLIKSFCGH